MTCAVSAAVREGAKAVICASTGNTAASAAAYAARAGHHLRRDRARGQDRPGQDGPDADARRARDLAGGQLRPGARARARAHRHPPDRARELGQRVPHRRTEDGRLRARSRRSTASSTRSASRSGNAGNITSYWRGFGEMGAAPRLFGFQAAGAAPLVEGHPSSTRKRSPARSGSATRCAGRTRWPPRPSQAAPSAAVSDEEILDAYRLLAAREGMFCEPASAASVAGLLKYGADGAQRVVCVLTGRGLKDPETALEHNDGAVIQCVAERGRDRGSGAG